VTMNPTALRRMVESSSIHGHPHNG
jgi:hypothetical protein